VILLAGLAATIAWAQGEDAVSLPPVVVTAPHPVEPPRYREITRPPYPEAARRQGLEGTVVLLIKVLTDGHTGDEAAVEAARRWAFQPATQGRAPVEAWVEVPVTFELAVPK
jgi:protein TonB